MDEFLIIAVSIGATSFFYMIFIGIGFLGVSRNRKAQNLDKES